MKNRVLFILPFIALSSLSLSSCKKEKEDNRILLNFGDVHAKEVTNITAEKFVNMYNNKENFMFVVSSNTCTCWMSFRPIIEKYITQNKLVCYQIDYESFKAFAPTYNLNVGSGTTTFAIFENGEVKYTLVTGKNPEMDDEELFFKFLDATIKKPKAFFINEEDYNNIRNSDKASVVYFERSGCGDCAFINSNMLRNYISNHYETMNDLYVLDCEPYYRKKDAADYQSYLDKKDELGLSTKNNPEYGFDGGYFPHFNYIENKQYKSGAVVFNDTLTLEGENQYRVTNTYYTTERVSKLEYTNTVIEGKIVNASQAPGGYWSQADASKVYEPILTSFLDYALPKNTYKF